MEKKKGKNNAESLFGIGRIPSDEQVKKLLDPVREVGMEHGILGHIPGQLLIGYQAMAVGVAW